MIPHTKASDKRFAVNKFYRRDGDSVTILRVRVDLSSFFFTVQISNEKILLYICTRFTRCLDDIRFIWIIIVSINITDIKYFLN